MKANISRHDFRDCVTAAMNLDPATAELGWKTSDEGKRAAAHQLSTYHDIDSAFQFIMDMQHSTRRKKAVALEIIELGEIDL